jgi:hypothetical protein
MNFLEAEFGREKSCDLQNNSSLEYRNILLSVPKQGSWLILKGLGPSRRVRPINRN